MSTPPASWRSRCSPANHLSAVTRRCRWPTSTCIPMSRGRPTGALGTPDALDDLIFAATRRDPAQRPRDASAFLAALVGIRSQLGLQRVPVPVPASATGPHRGACAAGLCTAGRRPAGRSRRHPDARRRRRPGLGGRPTAIRPQARPNRPARRPRSPTVALRQLQASPLADRDPGGAAARVGRGRRWLVAGRPMGGHPGRRRPVPGAGRNPGPGRRTGPAGDRRAPQRGRGREGGPVRPGRRHRTAARLEVDAAGVQRPAGGAGHRCPAPTGRPPPPR